MNQAPIRNVVWAIGLVLLSAAAARGQERKAAPDVRALAKAGRASADRLAKEGASWTASTEGPGGSRFIVDVVTAPGIKRSIVSLDVQGHRTEILRLIVRDGAWYVSEGQKRGKYRPFEAPFDFPTAYLYLAHAELRFVVEDDPASLGTYQATENGVATYRTPLAGPLKQQLQATLTDIEQFAKKDVAAAAKTEIANARVKIKDLLENGITSKVELANGIIVQSGTPDRQTRVTDFRWAGRVDPRELDVAGTKWSDFTDDPTAGGTDDLLMIGHCGVWRPGQNSPEVDGRLLDVKTGRYRRVPFRGQLALSGCFLKGRTRVAIAGNDLMNGLIGLYEVDLQSGANRRLGGELLGTGFSLFPTLSPDGKTVAVLHKGAAERLLESQACLVDLETGDARALGQAHDMAFPSWLPDGSGLLLLVREPGAAAGETRDTIARMDRNGKLTKIRDGGNPVLLVDGKTILFRDAGTHLWQTCDLDGGNAKPLAGGLKGFGFPAPAPDGKRLAMMYFQPNTAPVPTILTIGDSDGKPATTAAGLWAMPAWR